MSNVISQILIAGVKIQRLNKRIEHNGKLYEYSNYFVYVPKAYERYVIGNDWIVTIIIDNEKYPIGRRKLSRHNKYYIITLPSDLVYYWEKLVGKEVDALLSKP
ncbi:hypothetical protein [Saccharolobus shibatae]|uniref:Uncharacterized protein n=1 Tax=Saccharolobus shibatae TaxID=2286 RepID=A0A8F5GUX7_9CREN|nr:hypothetical protein [Saccharolobus shibatae]QXJ30538.1 hypothetical protein J5U21_00181 [Saccharolobus shibatae]